MKKTLLLTHEYFPFRGGIANYIHGLCEDLPDIVIFTDQPDARSQHKVIIDRLTGKILRPRWHVGLRRVLRIVENEQIDIIFTPHIFPLGQIAYQTFLRIKIPYVISLHGLDINLALAKDKIQTVAILQNAKHIITNSEHVKKIVTDLQLETPVTAVIPAFNRPRSTEVNQSILDTYSSQPMLLTVSRLVARKNHATVLQAVASLKDEPFTYIIIGNGPEKENIRRLIHEYRLEDKVTLLDNVSDADLPSYFRACRAFIMPTIAIGPDIEGYGIVYIEAGWYGKPVIASKNSCADELIQDGVTGILVDGHSVENMSEAIRILCADKAAATRMGEAALVAVQSLPTKTEQSRLLETILS